MVYKRRLPMWLFSYEYDQTFRLSAFDFYVTFLIQDTHIREIMLRWNVPLRYVSATIYWNGQTWMIFFLLFAVSFVPLKDQKTKKVPT